MRTRIALFALVFTTGLCGQRSSVVITPDADVTQLLNHFADVNEVQDKVEGWRVQILATTDRQQLERTERSFKSTYPSVPVDWVHNSPYYKLRAGAFYTRQEADRLRHTLTREFEGVYLVKDEVKESELLKMY